MAGTLYGEPIVNDEKVPQMKFKIRVEVYTENMTTAATHIIELNWTGSSFDISPEHFQNFIQRRFQLESKLYEEEVTQSIKLGKSGVFKK